MTGDRELAKKLSYDLAYGQTLRGHDIVDDLIAWLKEARKLATGNPHWSVWDLHQHEIEPIVHAFPKGHVIHIHCMTTAPASTLETSTYMMCEGKHG